MILKLEYDQPKCWSVRLCFAPGPPPSAPPPQDLNIWMRARVFCKLFFWLKFRRPGYSWSNARDALLPNTIHFDNLNQTKFKHTILEVIQGYAINPGAHVLFVHVKENDVETKVWSKKMLIRSPAIRVIPPLPQGLNIWMSSLFFASFFLQAFFCKLFFASFCFDWTLR